MELSFKKISFQPLLETPFPISWGYLFRIEKFKIVINGTDISSNGELAEKWPAEKINQLRTVRKTYIDILKDNEDTTSG